MKYKILEQEAYAITFTLNADFEYQGKKYKKYVGGQLSYKKIKEQQLNIKRFIDEYKKTI